MEAFKLLDFSKQDLIQAIYALDKAKMTCSIANIYTECVYANRIKLEAVVEEREKAEQEARQELSEFVKARGGSVNALTLASGERGELMELLEAVENRRDEVKEAVKKLDRFLEKYYGE